MRILILGCGNVGAPVAVQLMERHGQDIDLVLADLDMDVAQALAQQIGPRARAIQLDVMDGAGLRAALQGMQLVFNFVGPFYLSALSVIDAALEMGVDYMDINDDHDVAFQLVSDTSFHTRAVEAGTRIVIGCGSTPGLTNALARMGADRMDETKSIRVCWVAGFLTDYFSPAVWDHLFHMYDDRVTQYIDGRYQQVPAFSGQRNVSFLPPFGTYPAVFSGHGEAATIPHFIKGLEEASVRSFFLPQAGDDLLRQLVEMGFGSRAPLPGLGISPLQFMKQYATSDVGKERLRIAFPEEGLPGVNANQVEIEGLRDGNRVRLAYETHLLVIGGGDPTSVCARVALETWLRGEMNGPGLLAIESALDPEPFVRTIVSEAGMALHQREEVTKENCFMAA